MTARANDRGVRSAIGHDHRGADARQLTGVRLLMVLGRVRIRHQDRRAARRPRARRSSSRPRATRPDRPRRTPSSIRSRNGMTVTRAAPARSAAPAKAPSRPGPVDDQQLEVAPDRRTTAGRPPPPGPGAAHPGSRPSPSPSAAPGRGPARLPPPREVRRDVPARRGSRRRTGYPIVSTRAPPGDPAARILERDRDGVTPTERAADSPGRGPRSARAARSGCARVGRRASAGRSRSRRCRPRRPLPARAGRTRTSSGAAIDRRLRRAHRHLADERCGVHRVEPVPGRGDARGLLAVRAIR